MQSNNTAKIIILSSCISVITTLAIAYIARDSLRTHINPPTAAMLPAPAPPKTVTTNDQIISAIATANPAVVSVVITKDVPVYEKYYESYDPWGFFGGFNIPRVRENGTEEREIGGGSGFIVSDDGLIVTNKHVVADTAARYSVLLNDGTSYNVNVLARDPQLDIAIIKITDPLTTPLSFVTFGDTTNLQLGETAIAIGNALGEFRNSVSVGVISGLARSIVASDYTGHSEQLDQVIQTDAAINPGNSGGPLLNLHGEVIGVNVATSRSADNIGFALPADVVREVVTSVQEFGEIVRPFLGVRYLPITKHLAEINNLDVDYGVLIVRGDNPEELAVIPGSPADKAGLTENTIILSIDGQALHEQDLATILRRKTVGDTITLTILQAGEEKTVRVTLEKAL